MKTALALFIFILFPLLQLPSAEAGWSTRLDPVHVPTVGEVVGGVQKSLPASPHSGKSFLGESKTAAFGESNILGEHDSKLLVVLHPRSSIRNVLCFSSEAELLWTIEFPDYYSYREPPGYDGVVRNGPNQSGALLAYIRGRPCYLDIDTCKVTFIPGSFEK